MHKSKFTLLSSLSHFLFLSTYSAHFHLHSTKALPKQCLLVSGYHQSLTGTWEYADKD